VVRRLVVTGGDGFLGGAFMRLLDREAFDEVRVVRSREHDLRSPEAALAALEGATHVVHIAGVTGGIEYTRRNQGSIYYDNVMMNTNVLHSAMRHGARKVVAVGTVCSYPKLARAPFREDEIWDGYPEEVNAHYGLAKKMLMVQADAYRSQYGLRATVLLCTNLYGPRDHFDLERSHVLPALIVRFTEARESGKGSVTLWGDGSPTRDLLYVDDAATAIVKALFAESDATPINVGSGREVSIRDLAEIVRRAVGVRLEVVWDATRPNGQPRRVLDTSRAEREIGFVAQTDLETGVEKTLDWYLSTRR
jgi:GDP-L-fucose synthase